MTKSDDILAALKSLKDSDERIHACMVARRGLEGLMMFPENFKEEVSDIWDPLSRSMNEVLSMVEKFSEIGMKRAYTEMLGYGIFFMVLEKSDTALVALVKEKEPLKIASEVMGELDSTAKRIYRIMGVN
jgi:hypothetical protein